MGLELIRIIPQNSRLRGPSEVTHRPPVLLKNALAVGD